MATVTKDGHIVSSGPGIPGLHSSWNRLDDWLKYHLQGQRARWLAITGDLSGIGGGTHSHTWDRGYELAKENALIRLHHALGNGSLANLNPRPDPGTDKRAGYDAGKVAAELAISRIHP